jgi:hypothetical protein
MRCRQKGGQYLETRMKSTPRPQTTAHFSNFANLLPNCRRMAKIYQTFSR